MENINNIRVNFINNNEETPFTPNFVLYIESTVDNIFPSLMTTEKRIVNMMVKSLVTLVFFRFNFETENQYYSKLNENNNQDLVMIILLLFPYMKDDNNYEIHKGLKKISDIGINKINGKYVTNIQYDRSFFEEKREKDYEWNLMDLYNNYITAFHTIYKCAHHLYCNWIQVIPLTLENYQESYIYKETIRTGINDNLKINTFSIREFKPTLTYGGLDIRDYYHVFVNDLYYDILPYKWLLYERYDIEKNTDMMYIQEIFNFFGYIFTTDEEEYENNKNSFINKWDSFVQLARTNDYYKDILYHMLNHFDFKAYKYITSEDRENFKQVNTVKDQDEIYQRDDDFVPKDKEEKNNKLIETYNKIDFIPNIYEYLKDTIYELSFTWYGKLMFPDQKFKSIILLKDDKLGKLFNKTIVANSTISYKNIYNYAKNLLIWEGEIYKIREYEGLVNNQRQIIYDRLNNIDNDWFNITNNLRIKYGNLYNNGINDTIYNIIKPYITDIVFHCLVTRGILSEFKVKHSPDAIKKSLDSYYFVTQRKYTDLPSVLEDKNDIYLESFVDKITGKNLNNRKTGWYKQFALDWVQQIHFFKHFFNQRVMYITGGTGVGKSTQIPKLLWYGLFLIGIYDGKVINTQPRLNATTGNAKRISNELGVPIIEYDKTDDNMNATDNYYVQYQTEKEKHMTGLIGTQKKSPPPSSLNIVTDGTLLVELQKNIYLKETQEKKRGIDYTSNNIYDIIAIDEAHEHNANMDLILTIMRDVLEVNNTIRLVIITATIDDDEPMYRRYYKNVNDNLLYPLNNALFSSGRYVINYMLNEVRNITKLDVRYDRISNDRRVHVSAPLADTKYIITEEYQKGDIKTYDDAEKLGIQKTIELTRTGNGEILFFSTSVNKIRDIVNILNNSNIPPNWCALPYYTNLPEKWKDLIGYIGNTKINLDVDRRDIFVAIDDLNYRKVSNTLYTRYIIVATNVAEASITIPSLKYVIETGWQVSVSYDPFLGITSNKITEITETSRLQRRGRVGRTQAGSVYYMYKKDGRKNVLKIYPITQKIDELIYTLSRMLFDGFTIDKNNKEVLDEKITYETLNDSVKEQFYSKYYEPKLLASQFAGNPQLRNIDIPENPFENIILNRYQTGYDLETIYDFSGIFYLVHPFNNYIKTDEFSGKIIDFSTKDRNKYIEQFNELFKLRLVAITDNNLIKTKVFREIDELFNIIRGKLGNDLSYNKLWTYVLGQKYDLSEEVYWINTILEGDGIASLSQKITTKNNKQLPDSAMLIKKFGDTASDLNVYVNIFKKIKLVLPKLIEFSPGELLIQLNKKENETIIDKGDYKYIKNIQRKDRTQLSYLTIYKNTNEIDYNRVEALCDYYGLDCKNIISYIKTYLSNISINKLIGNWVSKNINIIPYFNNIKDIPFIYISAYSNLNNIDDISDLKKLIPDKLSIVKGSYIHSINRVQKDNDIIMRHMSIFNPSIHTKAIIPAFIFPLKNDTLIWKDKYLYYQNITPRMLGEYLLPEDNADDVKKDKVFNQQLLELFSLFRSKL